MRLAVAVAEGDDAGVFVVVDQIALADDAAVEIARQVFERRFTAADVAAVYDPLARQAGRRGWTGRPRRMHAAA